MIDIELFRTNPEIIREDLKKRAMIDKIAWVDEIVKLDKEWRAKLAKLQELQHSRNTLSLQINAAKKEKKDVSILLEQVKALPDQISQHQIHCTSIQQSIENRAKALPNITHSSVPYGKDASQNIEIRRWGTIAEPLFQLKSHAEVCENIGIADFERSARISGKGFYFISGPLAQLNQALIRFAIDHLVLRGYALLEPPFMMRKEPYSGVTDFADFANVMYKIEDEDQYLIATSEHPICAYFMNETIDESRLPLKFAGISPCFRKEVGAHGIDEKGLFRTHQFWKIEQFIFSKPEDSWKLHDQMIKVTEEIFQQLQLPYRVVNICTGDLGIVAAKKYDIEVWMPRTKEYKEVVSGSNCTDWQSRRLNIKYGKEGGNKQYVHTLNCTAIATSRAMVAILENFQNPDGSITIPKVLHQYMNDVRVILCNKEPAASPKNEFEKPTKTQLPDIGPRLNNKYPPPEQKMGILMKQEEKRKFKNRLST